MRSVAGGGDGSGFRGTGQQVERLAENWRWQFRTADVGYGARTVGQYERIVLAKSRRTA